MVYYASFIPGFRDIIETVIRERLAGAAIHKLLDGAVIFETDISYDKLNFFCFNNIFALIDILDEKDPGQKDGSAVIEFHIKKILSARHGLNEQPGGIKYAPEIIGQNNKKIQSFRLVCSSENKPVPINEKTRKQMENFIAGHSSLGPDRSDPDTEFWFLYRNEGFCCFLKRLTNNRQGEKSLHPGELSPQLAWLLCRIAGLKHGETAADPFCGYGSIPQAACRHFPAGKFYASDIDPKPLKTARSKQGLKTGRCEIMQADFRSLKLFPQGVDAIITDPPWGLYKDTGIPLQELYDEIIECFSHLLKKCGRAVILTAAVREMDIAVKKTGAFELSQKLPVLVSGKKAVIYVLNAVKC